MDIFIPGTVFTLGEELLDMDANTKNHSNQYYIVFGGLGLLTIITVAVGYLSLPVGVAVIVALTIAAIKGSLVGAFFMHLIGEQKPIKWLLLLTFFFLLAMIMLFSFSFMDQAGVKYVP